MEVDSSLYYLSIIGRISLCLYLGPAIWNVLPFVLKKNRESGNFFPQINHPIRWNRIFR